MLGACPTLCMHMAMPGNPIAGIWFTAGRSQVAQGLGLQCQRRSRGGAGVLCTAALAGSCRCCCTIATAVRAFPATLQRLQTTVQHVS